MLEAAVLEPAIQSKPSTWSAVILKKKEVISMSSKLEPAIWSSYTGHIVVLGGVDGRMVTKTKPNFRKDELPYFLTNDPPRARSSAINFYQFTLSRSK